MFPQTEIDGFRRYWRRRKPESSTAIHYASDVTIFFEWVGELAPAAITVHQIDQSIDWQRSLGWKPSTIRRHVIALRMFFDYLAYYAADDVALEDEGQDDRRERHRHAAGHRARDVHSVAADEFGNRHGRGLGFERAGEDRGIEEFSPRQQEGRHCGGDQSRHGDGYV